MKRLKRHYSPSKAQKNYRDNRHNCHKPRLLDQSPELYEKIVELINERQWSPQQIANRLKLEGQFYVKYNTIYWHIEQHNLNQSFTSHGDTGIRPKKS